MTEQEAKAIISEIKMNYAENGEEECSEALDMAIKALEEIKQYRTIGTVEEFRETVEKQTAKKPKCIDKEMETFDCPCCGHTIIALDDMTVHKNCLMCGQKLDWSDEE